MIRDTKSAAYAELFETGKAAFTVGIHEEEGDGEHDKKSGLSVVELASIHEFGLGVPERPFIRGWFDAKEAKLKSAIIANLKARAKTPEGLIQAAEQLALLFQGDLQKWISENNVQPNIDPNGQTARRKKSTVTLVDTGVLKARILGKVDASK